MSITVSLSNCVPLSFCRLLRAWGFPDSTERFDSHFENRRRSQSGMYSVCYKASSQVIRFFGGSFAFISFQIRNSRYMIECHPSEQSYVSIRCNKGQSRPRPPTTTLPPPTTAVSVSQDVYALIRQMNSLLSQHSRALEEQVSVFCCSGYMKEHSTMIHLQRQQIESIQEMLRKCNINGKAIRD